MPLKLLKYLFGACEAPPPSEAHPDMLAASADRFARWLAKRLNRDEVPCTPESIALLDPAIEEIKETLVGVPSLPESLASDCAAFIGEAIRHQWGGRWGDHPLFGLSLHECGWLGTVVLNPLGMVHKKWELGSKLSLARFVETFPDRLAEEARQSLYRERQVPGLGEIAHDLNGVDCVETMIRARRFAGEFQFFWKSRFHADLPLSLVGTREVERFLRGQFFLLTLHAETLVHMGFYVGEVGRELFGGEWDFAPAILDRDPTRVALKWPELDYYPVGKVFKLLTEQPENEALDEYLRLIPSARQQLRDQTPA